MSRARDRADSVLHNRTHEDTEGGRESIVTFKGEQSGGEISTLAQIQASHDGTADDQKADLIFKTNDGSDNAAPTERLRIDSNGSILTATLGTDNVHLGEGAGASIASGGIDNTVIGKNAGTSITTGDYNTLLGFQAGDALTTGNSNVAIGFNALSAEDANGLNIAIGANALGNLNAGANAENVAIGHDAGASATTGGENTIVGATAGDALTIGEKNVAIGHNALGADDVGSRNVAVGWDALGSQNATGGSVNNFYNTAVGANTGFSITTGYYNTFVGALAGDDTDDSIQNVAVGYAALSANAGNNNTAVGESALTSTTGASNAAFGNGAANAMTTGSYNTIIGSFNGNQDSIDIRSGSSYIVLSDGQSNVRQIYWAGDGRMYMRQTLSPWANGFYNLGTASNKWAALHASNGTIQTSDENEKQQIASLTSAEITAATAISKLFKTYKMNSSVEDKGDAARIHSGVIAQQVKTAMNNAGLDETNYGFWCSDTWWTKDREVEAVEADEERGTEAQDAYTFTDRWEKEEEVPEGATKHTVLGIRYDELLAFVCAATEQRLTSIETENAAIKARLDALEAE